MFRVLVSLVSEQTAPNLMLILDPAFAAVDHYLFVSTPEMNERGQVGQLLAASGLGKEQLQTLTVRADDPQHIHQILQKECLPTAGDYLVNLTCGTKVMSLAVWSYFSQVGFRAEMFYVSLGENAYRRIYPLADTDILPLQYRFSLRTYLTAYGINEQDNPVLYKRSSRVEEILFQDALHRHQPLPGIKQPSWWFAGHLDYHRRKVLKSPTVGLDEFNWIRPWLHYLAYKPAAEGLTEHELRYLQSAWLEHYVREVICHELSLPREATAVGTKLYREGADWKYRNQEFDVLFLYRNRLHIVECKTAMRQNRKETKTVFNNTLYKLAALKRDFGLNVRVSLLTLSDQLRTEKKGIRQPLPDYNRRATLFGIPIVDHDDLLKEPGVWLSHLLHGSGMTTTSD